VRESVALASLRGALAFDPDAVLVREPGVLMNPEFVSALHAELTSELGSSEAPLALLQIGFLHGLRDAARVVGGGPDWSGAVQAHAALLPIRFRAHPEPSPRGAIEIHGCWPERTEAGARLALVGASEGPECGLSAGYTSGWLSGILDADILAVETRCAVSGAKACHFVAREATAWRAEACPTVRKALEAVPFEALRELVARHSAAPSAGGVSSQEPVVQIWGPVMVIPFSGVDEALMTLNHLGRDPEASRVSVIVIDVTGAIIDEAFGAAALEQILESIACWGADAIVAGASPLSEPVVVGLERQPLAIHKDLDEAIAAAFRMAQAQRQAV
jgi:hypothetical protein